MSLLMCGIDFVMRARNPSMYRTGGLTDSILYKAPKKKNLIISISGNLVGQDMGLFGEPGELQMCRTKCPQRSWYNEEGTILLEYDVRLQFFDMWYYQLLRHVQINNHIYWRLCEKKNIHHVDMKKTTPHAYIGTAALNVYGKIRFWEPQILTLCQFTILDALSQDSPYPPKKKKKLGVCNHYAFLPIHICD